VKNETTTGKPKTESQAGREPGQVERWVEDRERRHADALTIDQARAKYQTYMQVNADKDQCGTIAGCALAMGFVSERGLTIMGERGGDFAALQKEIVESICALITFRMINAKTNQVGSIFYLKNRAGFRDKQADEVAAETDDWLRKVQGFAALTGRKDAREDVAQAEPAAADSDAAELLLFESGEHQDLAAEG
jgi:hypothetical protein